MRIRVRTATRSDLPLLAPVCQTLDRLHARIHPDFFRASGTLQELSHTFGQPNQTLLVAELDEKRMVGLIRTTLSDTPPRPVLAPARRAKIEELVILPRFRRRGIGRQLLTAAASWAKAAGASQLILTVWTNNRAAEGFYCSLGYRPISQALAKNL